MNAPSLPQHLCATYCVEQHYDQYSAQDQNAWRCVTKRLAEVLQSRCAIPYGEAFDSCGLVSTRLPRLDEIQHAIGKFGWHAIMVESFIPPRIFMALQASRTLPITRQIRSSFQIGYTPIPDIVHEAAGHLPMLADHRYRQFLQRVGRAGAELSYSELDIKVYEAQKCYAEYVARPNVKQSTQLELFENLEYLRGKQNQALTPACLFARLHWWTVEYGLIGTNRCIYGAGLLSSCDEALATDNVKCLPLSEACVDYEYEISRMQPQLFVAEDWDQLELTIDRTVAMIS